MIYLTGDVHIKIDNWEQKKAGSELDAAKRYLEILKKNKVACTFFINGGCLGDNSEKVKEFLKYDVELGGHTYDNFKSMHIIKSYLYRKFFNCIYGPAYSQKKDIKKTKKAFQRFGLKMKSWRTHAYGSNEKTFKILRQEGVRYVSDLFGEKVFEKNRIIHMVINIPVDNVTISYGPFRPENRDVFVGCAKSRIKPEEWFEILKKRIIENEKQKKPSILLIHPATMASLDDFKLFEKIAKFLSKYETKKISEFRF